MSAVPCRPDFEIASPSTKTPRFTGCRHENPHFCRPPRRIGRGSGPEARPQAAARRGGTRFQSINPDDCKVWLTKLASEEFEGRETGTEGFQKAADMVAAHFRDIGLKAVGDKDANGVPTYFQMVRPWPPPSTPSTPASR